MVFFIGITKGNVPTRKNEVASVFHPQIRCKIALKIARISPSGYDNYSSKDHSPVKIDVFATDYDHFMQFFEILAIY